MHSGTSNVNAMTSRFTFHVSRRAGTLLLAELKESLRMALAAVAAHKLRSALTLLGVLVGVFSIIVVMTALRVMQSTVEAELSQLGDQTFTVRKCPIILFSVPDA